MSDALHVIAMSGGKDSTAMALRLRETDPTAGFTLVCTPTGDELPEWHAHMGRVQRLTGLPLAVVTSGQSLNGLVERERMIPNFRARWCTRILKIEPYRAWLARKAATHGTVVSYVGLRADEEGRAGGSYEDIPGVEMRFPLREWGWGAGDVWAYLEQRNVSVPERTDCGRCWGQQLGEWWKLWREHPEVYADAEAQEERIGHTWRSPGRDSWPAALSELRAEFEKGRVPPRTKRQMDLFRSGGCRVCSL